MRSAAHGLIVTVKYECILWCYIYLLSTLVIWKSVAKNWQHVSVDYTMMFVFTQTKTFSVFWFYINPVTHCFILFPLEMVINNVWWCLSRVLVHQDRWMAEWNRWWMDERLHGWMDGSVDNGCSSLMIKSFLCFYCLYVREKGALPVRGEGFIRGLWGDGGMRRCDKVFWERIQWREIGARSGCVVVKVTSLPCEAEWYLNLTFTVTMSTSCHLCTLCMCVRMCVRVVGVWIAHVCTSVCLAGSNQRRLELSLIVCNKEVSPQGLIAALGIIWNTQTYNTYTHMPSHKHTQFTSSSQAKKPFHIITKFATTICTCGKCRFCCAFV